ncbi:unnamed protein product [Symbiodinium sp. CCMP2592]|nr:unnamed protein product [Symbiodinium sp. CCMP2592]
MTWAQGPDEGPMLAVEMSFDEEEYEMTFDAPEPPQELPRITEGAIFKRMWRMFRPRQDGSYLVPESMVKEYQNKVSRPTVVRAFERCGYHVEKFLKKVNKTLEDVEEVEIEEDWEFMTEDEMREANWKTHRSIVRRMMEAEEEGEIEDKDLAMDWGKMDMQGCNSSAPAGGANQGPSLDGVDKKTLQCFPDLEKVSVPSSIVPKAGAAVQKCLAKLSARMSELLLCVESDLVTKPMMQRLTQMRDNLATADAQMTKLYEQGMLDGYDGE